MSRKLKLASAQSRTLSTLSETLQALEDTTSRAAQQGVDLILFPEAYLGGYPRTCSFGSVIGARTEEGRDQFLKYFHDAVDLGDIPQGGGELWLDRKLELPRGKTYRGDGTRERLERIAKDTGVFIVTGVVERVGGTLYCGVVYVCPRYGVLGKRRKVMPTGAERLVWGQGSASTLRAVTTEIKGVRLCMAAGICWENYMPLLRQSIYSQNVNLYLAPTADARDTWAALMRTIGIEGRCFVMSANQCVREKNLPVWITGKSEGEEKQTETQLSSTGLTNGTTKRGLPAEPGRARRKSTIIITEDQHEICIPVIEPGENGDSSIVHDDSVSPFATPSKPILHSPSQPTASTSDAFACRGGSCIISPMGEVIAGPLWEVEDGGLLVVDVDFEDCERGRLDLDVGGSYSRMDSFVLKVEGLDTSPPP